MFPLLLPVRVCPCIYFFQAILSAATTNFRRAVYFSERELSRGTPSSSCMQEFPVTKEFPITFALFSKARFSGTYKFKWRWRRRRFREISGEYYNSCCPGLKGFIVRVGSAWIVGWVCFWVLKGTEYVGRVLVK